MGMFDYVNFEMKCPDCGAVVTSFQSKDLGCEMTLVDIADLENFYSSCTACGSWLEFSRVRPTKSVDRKASLDDAYALGFELYVREK